VVVDSDEVECMVANMIFRVRWVVACCVEWIGADVGDWYRALSRGIYRMRSRL
jgi:hypothetical protein